MKNKIPLPPTKALIPPSAIDLEEAILGAMMIDSKAFDVMVILKPKIFFKESHQIIFEAIENLYENNTGVDLLTVSTELKRMNKLSHIGGDFYLISLTQKVSSSAHIEYHSRIIIQKYILRKLIITSNWVIDKSYYHDPDVFDIIDFIEREIKILYSEAIVDNKLNLSDSDEAKKELIEKRKAIAEGKSVGLYTGVRDFDDWCNGLKKRELITLAARPGIGKTTASISIACHMSMLKNVKVSFMSLEMSSIDVKNRVASRITKISYTAINNGLISNAEEYEVFKAYDRIDESNLDIIDTTKHKNTWENIEKIIREQAELGHELVVLDYVQLVKLRKPSSNDTSDLKTITRGLKALAVELNICVVQLSQLGRQVDQRPDKTPYLADLKQSGSIEEDSDTVIFLARDAYYQILSQPGLVLPMSEIGKTKMIIAKGRNIGTGMFITFLDFLNYNWCSYSDRIE